MASTAGRRWLLGLMLAAAGACRIDSPDFAGTDFLCSADQPDCPAGRSCVAGHCVTGEPVPDAGGDADGGPPDAEPGVCELAAQADDNDGCGAAIDVTAAALAGGGVVLYGDTTGYAADLSPSVLPGCTESPEPGPDAIYRVDALAGDSLQVSLIPEGYNGAIYLLDGCSAAAACLGGSDVLGTGIDEATIAITAADTYYLIVDSNSTGQSGCFTLEVALLR